MMTNYARVHLSVPVPKIVRADLAAMSAYLKEAVPEEIATCMHWEVSDRITVGYYGTMAAGKFEMGGVYTHWFNENFQPFTVTLSSLRAFVNQHEIATVIYAGMRPHWILASLRYLTQKALGKEGIVPPSDDTAAEHYTPHVTLATRNEYNLRSDADIQATQELQEMLYRVPLLSSFTVDHMEWTGSPQ